RRGTVTVFPHILATTLGAQAMELRGGQLALAYAFGVGVDVDHAIKAPFYLRAIGLRDKRGYYWRSSLQEPVALLWIVPLCVFLGTVVPIVFFTIHVAMDYSVSFEKMPFYPYSPCALGGPRVVEARARRPGRDPLDDEHRRPLEARPRGQAVRALFRDVVPVSADLQRDLLRESRGVRDRTARHRLPLPGQDGRVGGRPGYGRLARGQSHRLGAARLELASRERRRDGCRLRRVDVLRGEHCARDDQSRHGVHRVVELAVHHRQHQSDRQRGEQESERPPVAQRAQRGDHGGGHV